MRAAIVVVMIALAACGGGPCVTARPGDRWWASSDVYQYTPGEYCIYHGHVWQALRVSLGPPGPEGPLGPFWVEYWTDLGPVCTLHHWE